MRHNALLLLLVLEVRGSNPLAPTAANLPRVLPRTRRRVLIAVAGVCALFPGWGGTLAPVDHEEILASSRSRSAGQVIGVALSGERPGEAWHATYHGSASARFLADIGLRSLAPHVIAPDFAAHVPAHPAGPGRDLPARADGYYRVVPHVRWPWWWPGGGVAWELPE